MAGSDLKIVESTVESLAKNFKHIKDTIASVASKDDTSSAVGQKDLVKAVESFNQQISDTQSKYEQKTSNFVAFLNNVSKNSTDADNAIAAGLQESK